MATETDLHWAEHHVRYDITPEGVAIITLDRPDAMNAWTPYMAVQLSELFLRADADPDVKVVVLTGAGRAFCAGVDIGQFLAGSRPGPERVPWSKRVTASSISKPVVAAINGAAVGIGIALAMHCDVRFVAEEAKLGFVFNRRGMAPEAAMHLMLPEIIGHSRATELLISGRIFLGTEAVTLGVAHAAHFADDVLERALDWARDVAINCSPASVGATKSLMWAGRLDAIKQAMDVEDAIAADFIKGEDSGEGMRAFREKRPPQWSSDHRGGYRLAATLNGALGD